MPAHIKSKKGKQLTITFTFVNTIDEVKLIAKNSKDIITFDELVENDPQLKMFVSEMNRTKRAINKRVKIVNDIETKYANRSMPKDVKVNLYNTKRAIMDLESQLKLQEGFYRNLLAQFNNLYS